MQSSAFFNLFTTRFRSSAADAARSSQATAFDDTIPSSPGQQQHKGELTGWRKLFLSTQQPVENAEELALKRSELASLLSRLDTPDPHLLEAIHEAADCMSLILIAASMFNSLAVKFGEQDARAMIATAMQARSLGAA